VSSRGLVGVLLVVAILAGCGDDETDQGTATTATTAAEVSLPEGRAAAAKAVQEGFSEPANVLGGDEEIGRLVERLDRDAALFFSEALDPKLGSPAISRDAGPCDGAQVGARGYPRYCSAEQQIVAPLKGAEAVRAKDGAASLYVLLGWAHARAAAAGLGWEQAYPQDQLTKGRLCLFGAWFRYLNYQAVLEDSDYAVVGRTVQTHPAFADARGVDPNVIQESGGVDLCGT
jgi:hypothetical protein